MKLICEAAVLAKAMRQVAPVAMKGAAVPVLANVLIECADGVVSLTTSNGDQWMTRTFTANVEAGGVTVDAGRLASVLSALDPGAQCELAEVDDGVTLKAGRSRFRFGRLPVAHYPRPLVADGEPVTFGDDLFNALRAVRHAVGTNVTLPSTLGAFIRPGDDGSVFVHASDGTRAARWQLPNSPALTALLPTSAIDHVLKLADDCDAAVEIVTTDRLASFDFGNARLVSKLIEGTWPLAQIDRITPTSYQRTAVVPREPFARSLHRLALIDDNKDRAVTIDFADNMMTIGSIATRDSGVEQVPCEYSGDAFRIGLRTGHTIQAMDAVGADEVTIGMNQWNEPAVISDAANPHASVMVMPYLIIPKGEA